MRRAVWLAVWWPAALAWAQAPAPAPAPAVPLPRLEVEASRSEARFLLSTTWHIVEGTAREVTGSVTSESGDPFVDGRVSVEIKAATMETGNTRRDRTMRDLMAVQEHPVITFTSVAAPDVVSISRFPSGAVREAILNIPGDLTIRGVTRRVVLPAAVFRQEGGYRVSGDLAVSLADFGIPDPSIFVNRVRDRVSVTVNVFVQAAAR